jgi:hypothetical protein
MERGVAALMHINAIKINNSNGCVVVFVALVYFNNFKTQLQINL